MIDETPIGVFVEIEAPTSCDRERGVAARRGRDHYRLDSYRPLYAAWCGATAAFAGMTLGVRDRANICAMLPALVLTAGSVRASIRSPASSPNPPCRSRDARWSSA